MSSELGKAVLELSTDSTKFNAGVDLAKLKAAALGTDFKKTGAQAKAMGSQLTDLSGSLRTLAGTLGVMFSVGAVVNFGRELFRMGDEITRVADRTGLTTDEVQRMGFAAAQSGNTLDELTSSIGQMQNRLASGEDSALGALKQIGVGFADLEKMGPAQQFEAIAAGIGKIENPAVQAQVAMDLFGKSGIAILPTLKSHYDDLIATAPVMSAAVVKSLDEGGDSFARFGLTIKVWAANSFTFLGEFMDGFTAQLSRFVGWLIDVTAGTLALASKIPGVSKVLPGLEEKIRSLREQAKWYRDAAEGAAKQTDATGAAAKKAVPGFALLAGETGKLTKAQKEAAKAAEALKKAQDAWFGRDLIAKAAASIKEIGGLAKVTELSTGKQKELNAQVVASIEAHKNLNLAIPPLLVKIQLITDAAANQIPLIHHLGDEFNRLNSAALNLPVQIPLLGQNPAMFTLAPADWKQLGLFGTEITQAGATLGEQFGAGFTGALQSALSSLSGLLSNVISGGMSLGGAIKDFATNFAKDFTAQMLAFIPGIGPMLAQFAGPMIDGIKKLFGGMFGNATKSTIEGAFGSYDALREKLLVLGDEGERLWIQLTQKTGKNDTAGVAALIEEITAALEAQAAKEAEVADAAEESAAVQSEAALRIQESIQGIDDEMQSLADSIANEAPEEEMGVIEAATRRRMEALAEERKVLQAELEQQQQDAADGVDGVGDSVEILDDKLRENGRVWETWGRTVRDVAASIGGGFGFNLPTPPVPIPMAAGGYGRVTTPTLFFSRGQEDFAFSGEGRSFGGGGSGRPIEITVISKLDGRVVARDVVRHIPHVLALAGV